MEKGVKSKSFLNKKFQSKKKSVFLPLLVDTKTEAYVRFAKVVLILRYNDHAKMKEVIETLLSKYKDACSLCSEDKYFSGENNAENRLKSCYKDVLKSCENGKNLVIVNVKSASAKIPRFYDLVFKIAHQAKYVVLLSPPLLSEASNENPVASRSSDARIRMPSKILQHGYFGWFINEADSAALREEAALYIKDCVEIPLFKEMFKKFSIDISDIALYFNIAESKTQSNISCLTKFCLSNVEVRNYLEKTLYYYGRKDVLEITGFVISPWLVGARLKLNSKQKELFEMDELILKEKSCELFETLQKDMNTNELCISSVSSKCKCSLQTLIDKPFNPNDFPKGKGRSAHFIIGTSLCATPENACWNVVEASGKEYEAFKLGEDVDTFDLDKVVVKRYEKYWVLYLKNALSVDALFASKCFLTV